MRGQEAIPEDFHRAQPVILNIYVFFHLFVVCSSISLDCGENIIYENLKPSENNRRSLVRV